MGNEVIRRPQRHYPISEILHIPDPPGPRKPAPASGWRRLVYAASFGSVNVGESRIEQRFRALRDQIRHSMPQHLVIGVVSGKGGVGKTTLTACIGGIIRECLSDNVVAIDAAPGFGTLADRIDSSAPDGYTDIISKTAVAGYTDIREHLGQNNIGLDVLSGNQTSDQPRPLVPSMLNDALDRLCRTHQIVLIDTADNLEHPVMRAVFDSCDALLFVSGLTGDTAMPVARSIDLLRAMDYNDLLSRSMVILNNSRKHATENARHYLIDLFTEAEIHAEYMPYDPHLAKGGIIDTQFALSSQSRLRLFEITAALAQQNVRRADRLSELGWTI
ncbi:MinD/ParA family protein [Mycobacterium sp. UM_Kg1]|uniref:MinD/ParA family ATP-binding protein n=1 Tax=Mycobacterium sp. UM_Kg1 TaxID=1545691 RepID=UPI00061AC4C0|nr:MinD/ParA family protein [Mycobacterium sp. UM_Kg1]